MKDSARTKGYRNKCYICLRIEKNKYYARVTKHNRQTPRISGVLWNEKRKQYLKELRSLPCLDCGQTFPWYAMDFDHLPQYTKTFTIMEKYRDVSWPTLLAELSKCEVICAVCHRIRTYKRLHV